MAELPCTLQTKLQLNCARCSGSLPFDFPFLEVEAAPRANFALALDLGLSSSLSSTPDTALGLSLFALTLGLSSFCIVYFWPVVGAIPFSVSVVRQLALGVISVNVVGYQFSFGFRHEAYHSEKIQFSTYLRPSAMNRPSVKR